MWFFSTRDAQQQRVSLCDGIRLGLSPDGGLFVPQRLPHLNPDDFRDLRSLPEIGERLLRFFFRDEILAGELAAICAEAFSFPVHRRDTADPRLAVLELFHGPTAAFKDVGARFLAACLRRLTSEATVLVATSGDTGGAVAAAFAGVPGLRVVVLYPRGMVSPRQEHQLTCWPDNVLSLRVEGTFDDCQKLAKQTFLDAPLKQRLALTSANSISVGRLLPQMVYYAQAALDCWRNYGVAARFIVPTGNLGNALAGIWTRRAGLPIAEIVLATNTNRSIPAYLASGRWEPQQTVATLASAMDVGNPSNMERLRHLLPSWQELTNELSAFSVTDDQIKDTIRWADTELGMAVCPHTATAMQAYRWLAPDDRLPWTALATAHPAKFDQVVEPILGRSLPVPPALDMLLKQPSRFVDIKPDLATLRRTLYNWVAPLD